MPVARLVRAQFLSLREKEFVEAARALGAPPLRQVARHILPNAVGPVIVAASLDVAAAILAGVHPVVPGAGLSPRHSHLGTHPVRRQGQPRLRPALGHLRGDGHLPDRAVHQLHRRRPPRRPRPPQGHLALTWRAPDALSARRHAASRPREAPRTLDALAGSRWHAGSPPGARARAPARSSGGARPGAPTASEIEGRPGCPGAPRALGGLGGHLGAPHVTTSCRPRSARWWRAP